MVAAKEQELTSYTSQSTEKLLEFSEKQFHVMIKSLNLYLIRHSDWYT